MLFDRLITSGTFGRVFECADQKDDNKKKAVKANTCRPSLVNCCPHLLMRMSHSGLSQVVRAVERYKHDAMVEASVLDELAQLDPKNEWCVSLRI